MIVTLLILALLQEPVGDDEAEAPSAYVEAMRIIDDAQSGPSEWREAYFLLGRAISQDPEFADAYFQRARVQERLPAVLNADIVTTPASDFARAADLDPGNLELRVAAGQALLDARRFEEAVTHLDAAVELDSDNARVFALRSRANAALGDHEQALADISRALQQDLDDHGDQYYEIRARLYESMGDLESAIQDRLKQIEWARERLDGTRRGQRLFETNSLLPLVEVYLRASQFDNAIGVLNEIVENNEGQPLPREFLLLGKCYLGKQDEERAREWLTRSVDSGALPAGASRRRRITNEYARQAAALLEDLELEDIEDMAPLER